jgi:uncharacterized phage-like protein YoqJ
MQKNNMRKSYRYGPYEGHESRCQRRLQDELGIDEAAAEAILHLRDQVVELQTQIHQLEVELAAHSESQRMRLARYRQVDYEASWIEIDFQE